MKTKKIKQMVVVGISISILALLLTFCRKDNFNGLTQEEYINILNGGGVYESPDSTYEKITVSKIPVDSTINDTSCICSKTHYDILNGNSNQLLFSNQADIIYPGNLLQGKTLNDEYIDIIAVKRAGGSVSFNLNNGNLQSFFSVSEVTKSSIQNAMNTIISNNPSDAVPADFNFSYYQVQSEKQLALKLGLSVEYGKFKLAGNLKFTSDKKCNRYLVTLSQRYYTMSFDIPTSYKDIFAESVTAADLAKYVGPGNPATYISQVTYGRFFYMLIESTSSNMEIDAAINASYSGVTKVAGNTDMSYIENLKNLTVKGIAYGGDGATSMEIVSKTNLESITNLFAKSTNINMGLPLSYVVRNVVDNKVVSVKLATDYYVYDCQPKANALVDVDGHVYKTVTINGKVWMAENLRVTHLNDLAPIPYINNKTEWANKTGRAYCYDNYSDSVSAVAKTYGCLYNWFTVGTGKLAPKGWHVPNNKEWQALVDYLGGNQSAGAFMKEAGIVHWISPNTGANDEYGFTALPGGLNLYNGTFGYLGTRAYFWSADYSGTNAYYLALLYNNKSATVTYTDKNAGVSIRCVKD
jgi:uncharacterized protein (TIGR02145 family)